MDLQARLKRLGLELPPAPKPAANYLGWRMTGPTLWVAGVGPTWGSEIRYSGKAGLDLSLETAKEAARLTVLNLLSHLNDACCNDFSRVKRCLKVFALVHSGPDFDQAEAVVDAGSQLLIDLMGERGMHARTVTMSPALPFGITVEMDAVFEMA